MTNKIEQIEKGLTEEDLTSGKTSNKPVSGLIMIKQIYSKLGRLTSQLLKYSLITGFVMLAIIYFSLPDISVVKYYQPEQTTEIYDRNNILLAKIHNEENRVEISAKKIPEHLKNAVIAIEDEHFYKHKGVDFKDWADSAASLFSREGIKFEKGNGTITQKLARSIYLSKKRIFSRKLKEILLALKIEEHLSKGRILEVYLNEIYWGHGAYGVEAAARTYFGKPATRLNLAESSMLAGIPGNPEIYSPYKSIEKARWRQALVLKSMVRNKYISGTGAEAVKKMPVNLRNQFNKKQNQFQAPYFSSYVISILKEKYGENILKKSGLKVFTTIDLKEQQIAEKIISEEIGKLGHLNIQQGSLVSVEPKTGFIRAMVGGTNYEKSKLNRVTHAYRPLGSTLKPVIYLAAFKEKLVTPKSYIRGESLRYSEYSGRANRRNTGSRPKGSITVEDAIKYSVKTVALRLVDRIGSENIIDMAKELGIKSRLYPDSLALETSEVTPLEIASVYSVFASRGKKFASTTPILRIEDKTGKVIEDYRKPVLKQLYSPEPFIMLDNSLKAAVSRGGTGYAASIPGFSVAGKTSTTSSNKDSWFAGYVPELVTVVWAGNDDNSGMIGATGGRICAPIWNKFMSAVLIKDKTLLVKNNTFNDRNKIVSNGPVNRIDESEEEKVEKVLAEKTTSLSVPNLLVNIGRVQFDRLSRQQEWEIISRKKMNTAKLKNTANLDRFLYLTQN